MNSPSNENGRSYPERDTSVSQLLLALIQALWSAAVKQLKQFGVRAAPILRLPNVALALFRATVRYLCRSRIGQLGFALASSIASVRYRASLTHHHLAESYIERRAVTASLATTVDLLWGCFRCVLRIKYL